MRSFFVSFAVAATALLVSPPSGFAQQIASTPNYTASVESYVCPKCGKIHTRRSTAATTAASIPNDSPVETVSFESSNSNGPLLRAGGAIRNVLGSINAQRSRLGIARLRYDPTLQAVAQRRAEKMAAMGLKSHPPGSFAPGRYEGVGWSSSYSPSGVSACFTSDPRMQYAGAAMATGRDGVYFAVVYR